MKNFRRLKVWQKSHAVALEIYKVTKTFPKTELYGLTSQMRRASVSVSSNVAEGCGRGSDADFARFLYISLGSANELEYLILLSHDLRFLDESGNSTLGAAVIEVKRMLSSLIRRLKADS